MTKHFYRLKPSNRQFKKRKREDTEDVRELIRPHTWHEDEEENNIWKDSILSLLSGLD